ncbi:hypothetical protein M0805_003756 [Coniferiporia weirii]|nr:hypothetical protein M0805_003756 [Coniferiporia weirii]
MASLPDVHQLYKRLETVGKGAYGSVHRGIEIATGTVVALKIINLDTADDDVADIQREVALLAHLRDAVNITRYYGCHLDGPRVWIVMEYASGGSVRTLMKACKDGRVAERYVILVTRELLLALAYLHKAGVIHRDIKAANVLITSVGRVMLCDFGVSALLVTAHSKRNTLVGTPYWMAPEVAQPVPAYDTKADIWSLGITIYEMVTGSPPHSNLDGMKVVHLIPHTKPPRLAEGDGSKDLRDFVAVCLRESPADRPTADELSRSKWIKATAKTPVSVLKELLTQYEAWQQAGGTRASIAEPLAWEEEEEESMNARSDDHESDGQESWEFDTVRGRPGADLDPPPPLDESDMFRPPPRVPTSLRGLFGDDSHAGAPSDPFRLQNAWGRSVTPPSVLPSSQAPTPSISPSPEANRSRPRRAEDLSAEETARRINFVFPPRSSVPPARAKSKLSTSVPPSDSETPPSPSPERTRLLPLGPGHGQGHSHSHGRGIGEMTMSSSPQETGGATLRSPSNYREVRTSRGVPNISIPPVGLNGNIDVTTEPGLGTDLSAGLPVSDAVPSPAESPTQSTMKGKPLFGRKRSQSSAAASPPSTLLPIRHRNNAFPNDFHFPPVSATASIAGPSYHLPILTPSHKSNSSGSGSDYSRSPAAHHTTHSLDTGSGFGTYHGRDQGPSSSSPGSGLGLPPSISRAHSASESHPVSPSIQPLSHRSSVTRQASVAVMESAPYSPAIPPSVSPERPEPMTPAPIPGLKDVLKIPSLTSEMRLGMSDLLPPSPSTTSANRRFFAPTASSLSTSVTPTLSESGGANHGSPSLASQTPSPAFAYAAKSSNLPSPAERQATDASTSTTSSGTTNASASTSVSQRTHSHSHTASSASSVASASVFALGAPPVRPLDFASLMASHEATHTELARAVDELVQWLGVVETGLDAVLARTAPDGAASGGPGAEAISDSTFMEGTRGEETYLEQVHEDEEYEYDDHDHDHDHDHDIERQSDGLSAPEEDGDEYADDGDVSSAPGTFEQFLANMERNKHHVGGGGAGSEYGYSSDDAYADADADRYADEDVEPGFSPEYTVHPHEQLAASVK